MARRLIGSDPSLATASERALEERAAVVRAGQLPVPVGMPPTAAFVQRMQALIGNEAVVGLVGAGSLAPSPSSIGRAPATDSHRTSRGRWAVQRQDVQPGSTAGLSATTAPPTGEGWTDTGTQVLVYQPTGANVRDQPLPPEDGSTVVAELPQNSRVLSLRHNHVGYAQVRAGQPTDRNMCLRRRGSTWARRAWLDRRLMARIATR